MSSFEIEKYNSSSSHGNGKRRCRWEEETGEVGVAGMKEDNETKLVMLKYC